MPNRDLALYAWHWVFFGAFGLTRVILRVLDRDRATASETAPVSQQEHTAPFSRALLAFHGLAFFVMYFGIGTAVFSRRVPV